MPIIGARPLSYSGNSAADVWPQRLAFEEPHEPGQTASFVDTENDQIPLDE
jgi:hypothetical protein